MTWPRDSAVGKGLTGPLHPQKSSVCISSWLLCSAPALGGLVLQPLFIHLDAFSWEEFAALSCSGDRGMKVVAGISIYIGILVTSS